MGMDNCQSINNVFNFSNRRQLNVMLFIFTLILLNIGISDAGCRFKGVDFIAGDDVPTDEPCLLCQCKNTATICKLRICPDIPIPPPPGCVVVHKAKKCCSQLICPENNRKYSREQRLPSTNTSLLSSAALSDPGKGYCLLDGTVYAEGSAMRSSTLCQYCFCIRGEMKCSSPQCVIPLNGCKPKFRSYACCPTNYDCNESNGTAILKNIPSSTPIPQFLKGCQVNGRFVAEGEPVAPMQLAVAAGPDLNYTNPCQTCFCMGGVVRCRPLQCDRPIAGCKPVTEDGHCCPDRYQCDEHNRDNLIDSSSDPRSSLSFSSMNPDEMPFTTTMSIMEETTSKSVSQTASVTQTRTTATTRATTIPQTQPPVPVTHPPTVQIIATVNKKVKTKIVNKGSAKKLLSKKDSSASSRNRSDTGSREQRRNKDKDDYRNFYDDDEKEDMSSLSFEHGQKYKRPSLLFDETTEQSDSNSEMETEIEDSDTEPPPTEDTLSTGVFVIETENDMEQQENTSPITPEAQNVTNVNSTDSTYAEVEVEVTTTTSFMQGVEDESSVTTLPPATNASPQSISSTFAKIKEILAEAQPEIAAGNIASVSPAETSSTQGTIATETPAATSFTSFEPSRASTGGESVKLSTEQTTVGNVQFIPFGVEDAVHPRNDTHDSLPILEPVRLTIPSYDNHAIMKGSLIPPTPQKGYKINKIRTKEFPSSSTTTATSVQTNPGIQPENNGSPILSEDLRNAIMDVPVSTSLYSNGFYRPGSIADDHNSTTPLELEQAATALQQEQNSSGKLKPVQTPTGFQGHIFEDMDSSSIGIGEAIVQPALLLHESLIPSTTIPIVPEKKPKVQNVIKIQNANFVPSDFDPTPLLKPLEEGNDKMKPSETPSRTYSKFGIQDSTYYRYGYVGGATGGMVPIPEAAAPVVKPKNVTNPQPDHHRYINPPPINRNNHRYYANKVNNNKKQHTPFDDFESYDAADDDDGTGEQDSYERYHQQNTRSRLGVGTVNINSSPSVVLPDSTTNSKKQNESSSSNNNNNSNKKEIKTSTTASSVEKVTSPPAGFKPAVAFPFTITKKPSDSFYGLGLKLSGCNIYGKMYGVGSMIRELSSSCVQCMCTEVGVQCSETSC